MALIFPDVVQVEVVESPQLDELAGRTVGPAERTTFKVWAQLDATRGHATDPSEAGGLNTQRYRMQVRQRDWRKKDPREDKRPRAGDHVTGVRKRYGTSKAMEPLDLYVDTHKPVATSAGAFGAWEITLSDRAPR